MHCCRKPRNASFPKSRTHQWQLPLTHSWPAAGGALDGFRRRQVRPRAQTQRPYMLSKAKADEFLAEVDNAIKAINSFVAYKVLKKLRPWQPSQKAQLKDSKRFLLSPAGELDALRKYATDVFGKYPRLSNNFVGLPPLDSTLLAKHIAPSNRARPSLKERHQRRPGRSAPSLFLRCCQPTVRSETRTKPWRTAC